MKFDSKKSLICNVQSVVSVVCTPKFISMFQGQRISPKNVPFSLKLYCFVIIICNSFFNQNIEYILKFYKVFAKL